MWFCGLTIVFSLLHIIYCQTYDDLAKDDCLKKTYVCGDLKSRVTAENGEFITNSREFVGICKANKEFMECVDQAEVFCKGKLNDFSEMVLRNRKGLKDICAEPVWGQRYINHAHCINKNERKISRECRREVRRRPDGRPWWCLIPEPCVAIRNFFTCTVERFESTCGQHAGEIYRKIQVLKRHNQDVVCEYRIRNQMYCKYDSQITSNRPRREVKGDEHSMPTVNVSTTLDSIQSAISEAVRNVAKAVTIDVIENLVKTVESSALKLENGKLFNETSDKFIKEVHLLEGNVIADDDYQELINIDEIKSKNTKYFTASGDKLSETNFPTLMENILTSVCLSGKITEQCFRMAKNRWQIVRTNEVPEQSTEISNVIEHIKTVLTKTIKLLQEQSIVIDRTDEDITIYFDDLGRVEFGEFQCSLVSNGILKCTFNIESDSEANDQTDPKAEHVESDVNQKVLQVDSTVSEYLTDNLTDVSLSDTTETSVLDASELESLSPEIEDRVGDALNNAFYPLEIEESNSSPLEVVDSILKEGKSESLETTTKSSVLDAGVSYFVVRNPFLPYMNPDRSYILVGSPYLPTEHSVYIETENEDHKTVYIVSPETMLNDQPSVDSVDINNIALVSPLETSTDIENLEFVEDDKNRKIEDVQQKLKEVLSEVLEASTEISLELKEKDSKQTLQNLEDEIHGNMNESSTVKPELSDPSYETMELNESMLLNGLADVHSGDSEHLHGILPNFKLETTEEFSLAVDGSLEEQASLIPQNEEQSTTASIEPTLVTGKSEL